MQIRALKATTTTTWVLSDTSHISLLPEDLSLSLSLYLFTHRAASNESPCVKATKQVSKVSKRKSQFLVYLSFLSSFWGGLMDSGNSNSMQSSSGGGGDEEYDSRADSISSFLNNNSSSYAPPPAPVPAQQQQQHHHHLHQPSLFDHLSSNYNFDPLSASSSSSSRLSSSLPLNTNHHPNSLLNLDMVWSKSLRSEPNCTDLGGLFVPSSSSSATAFPALHVSPRDGGTESVSSKAPSFLATAPGPGLNIDQSHINLNNSSNQHSTMMVRNPKKRSRASRRAPTTVLTTDTTNFRAMVQEFTGIPAPPFTSSHFPRTRLDLFGNSSSTSSSLMMRSTIGSHLDSSLPQPPSYNLLRPFAQKLINPIPFSTSNNSSIFIDAIASASTSAPNATATTTSTNINYQQLPSHQQNLFGMNMQHNNPILNLHSLLQVPPKYPLANSPILETKPPPPPPQGSSLEELGLSHAAAVSASHLNTNLMSGFQSLVSSSDNNNSPTSWHGHGTGTGATAAAGSNENEEATAGLFANGKLSRFSQASSEFHRDKGQESVNVAAATTRTEGMVESWICSSD